MRSRRCSTGVWLLPTACSARTRWRRACQARCRTSPRWRSRSSSLTSFSAPRRHRSRRSSWRLQQAPSFTAGPFSRTPCSVSGLPFRSSASCSPCEDAAACLAPSCSGVVSRSPDSPRASWALSCRSGPPAPAGCSSAGSAFRTTSARSLERRSFRSSLSPGTSSSPRATLLSCASIS